jgi:hypothetical protein
MFCRTFMNGLPEAYSRLEGSVDTAVIDFVGCVGRTCMFCRTFMRMEAAKDENS